MTRPDGVVIGYVTKGLSEFEEGKGKEVRVVFQWSWEG